MVTQTPTIHGYFSHNCVTKVIKVNGWVNIKSDEKKYSEYRLRQIKVDGLLSYYKASSKLYCFTSGKKLQDVLQKDPKIKKYSTRAATRFLVGEPFSTYELRLNNVVKGYIALFASEKKGYAKLILGVDLGAKLSNWSVIDALVVKFLGSHLARYKVENVAFRGFELEVNKELESVVLPVVNSLGFKYNRKVDGKSSVYRLEL